MGKPFETSFRAQPRKPFYNFMLYITNVNLRKELFHFNHMCYLLKRAIFLNLNTDCTTDRVVLID